MKLAEREAALLDTLAKTKAKQRTVKEPRSKRRPIEALTGYVAVPLNLSFARNDVESYRTKSYNLVRQVTGLVDHVYVRYPVPFFLYRSVLSAAGLELIFEEKLDKDAKRTPALPESKYQPWFFAVAAGKSFAKEAKGVLTKKEAHWFLQAPWENSIPQNILWAQAAAADVPREGCDYVAHLEPRDLRVIGDRLPELFRFLASAWTEMRPGERSEIMDFIRDVMADPAYTLKGRTLGSVRKQCYEWHRTVYNRAKVNQYRSWIPKILSWESQKGASLVTIAEITNNLALKDEGQTQRHCVFLYENGCVAGHVRILTARWYVTHGPLSRVETNRLTLEVRPAERRIVQIRGKLNRRATEEEMKILSAFAGERGLFIDRYA